ncbi:hypothetical protein KM176_12120 [Pseudooceanicola sp. CBS1P-1]|uniref:Lipoprotein n=1 Tax=Pseudooceanicola albus TaxID=2692189 RepID=A0A6L7G320_9RHOB|nr:MULTISPECIES: hypothetical protein [Pseudooceanicola]MBT9384608.1 hypothetical protein [Pseudooceanicola endophyticus]MXN18309.1 hypothetical protein [Pseudooceanicola albus]
MRPALLLLPLLLAACATHPLDVPGDKSRDYGFNAHPLSDMVPGIWVDPEGCDHWIIDDGLEGYMSERMGPDGRPVCSQSSERNIATGGFKDGSPLPDPARSRANAAAPMPVILY